MSSVKQTIPSGLYAALEKATAQFPLKALQSGGRAKLDKIMPSFQRKPSQLDTDQGNAKTINFDKIVLLLNGLHTSTLFERHVAVLEKLSVALQRGGIVRNDLEHLDTLTRILSIIFARIEEGGTLLLKSIPKFAGVFSPKINIPSDYTDSEGLKEKCTRFIDHVASFLALEDPVANHTLAKALFYFSGGTDVTVSAREVFNPTAAIAPIPVKETETHDKVDLDSILVASAESSTAVRFLTAAYSRADNNEFQVCILHALRRHSLFEGCQEKFLSEKTVELLQDILQTSDSDYIVFVTIEILWNLLGSSQKKSVAQLLGTSQSLSVLKILFEHFCINGHRQTDKQLRNEILILCNEIASLSPESLPVFIETEFVGCISLFMMHVELGIEHPDVNHLIITQEHEDYEFKKLIVILTSTLCKQDDILKLFLDNDMVTFLLAYLDLEFNHPVLEHWSPHQTRNLQLQILGFFNAILPRIYERLENDRAFTVINLFLRHIVLPEDLTKIQIFTTRETSGLVQACIHLIITMSELGPEYRRILGPQGIFHSLVDIIGNTKYQPALWQLALLTCGSLCQDCKPNKELFRETDWETTLIPLLEYKSPKQQEEEQVRISTIECIWGSACGSIENETRFFEAGGIFLLLNLLETGSHLVQKHSLGCLLDFLENARAVFHFLEWRSTKNPNNGVANLLIQLWISEEIALGVKQGPSGSIVTGSNPLLGSNQVLRDFIQEPSRDESGGRAVEELSENFRAKIFAMFSKMSFGRFMGRLSNEENIKLHCISKYLDFKIGEVWTEVSKELYFENIRPVTPDVECIRQVQQEVEAKIKTVQTIQLDSIDQNLKAQKESEHQFFSNFRRDEAKQKVNVLKTGNKTRH